MIVIIAGSHDEAQRYAAVHGFDAGRWLQGLSRMQLRAVQVSGVHLVGSYQEFPGWRALFDYASGRVGTPLWDVP